MSNIAIGKLTSGRLLAKNSFLNLAGQLVPIIAGFLVIPQLVHKLGTTRFGILTLAWAVIGYSNLFDLGLGRALTNLVADKLGIGEAKALSPLVWTGLWLMFLSGLLGTLVMAPLCPWLVRSALNVPADLQHEVLFSFYEIAGSIPVVIVTSGLRGILEAQQLFMWVNAVRAPTGILTFVGPWIVLFFSNSLVNIVFALVIVRCMAFVAQAALVLWQMPSLYEEGSWQVSAVKPLVTFGGWMTVTNLVGPIMVSMDRFLIGAFISMSAVAYYATPYEIVTKFSIVSASLAAVLFPAFSAATRDMSRLTYLLDRGVNYVFLSLFPPCLILVTFAYSALRFWLGDQFAHNSTMVLQLLAIGMLINSLAQIPFALVQGIGRPDLTAKLHLLELPFYLPLLWWLIHVFGIKGAAIAWVIRVLLDAFALFLLAVRVVPNSAKATLRMNLRLIFALILLVLGILIPSSALKLAFVICILIIFSCVAWFSILAANERSFIAHWLRALAVVE